MGDRSKTNPSPTDKSEQTKKGTGDTGVPSNIEPDLTVSLKKTACFGKCPSYEVKLYEDGRATYQGFAYTSKKGVYEAKAPADLYKKIAERARGIHLNAMSAQFPADRKFITDIPQTISFIRLGGVEKRIVDNFDAPADLIAYEKFLESVFDSLDWSAHK